LRTREDGAAAMGALEPQCNSASNPCIKVHILDIDTFADTFALLFLAFISKNIGNFDPKFWESNGKAMPHRMSLLLQDFIMALFVWMTSFAEYVS
jgi:hypothetical protein